MFNLFSSFHWLLMGIVRSTEISIREVGVGCGFLSTEVAALEWFGLVLS